MPLEVQIAIDCHDADLLADWWAKALDYVLQPPPPGFDSWPAFLEANDLPVPEPGAVNAIVDPGGAGPRILFQRVPEPKVGKNRVHLDVRAGDRREAKVAELTAAGGKELARVTEGGGSWVVMADPEGNELCITGTAPDDAA
jgi:hypothetical protein